MWIMAALAAVLLLLVPTAYAAEKPMAPAPAAPAQSMEKAAPAATSQPQMVQGKTTLMGTIVAQKNAKGKIIGYALKEDNGEQLMLSKHGKGKALHKMVGKRVEAVGTLEESKGQKIITVTEFKEIQ